jgi:hypothetical protein
MEPLINLSLLYALTFLAAPDSGNALFATAVEKGLTAGGTTLKPPSPTFIDGQSADEQRVALLRIAGSERKLAELLADSVTAPYILKLGDVKAESTTLRSIDLWFVLHADLDAIKTDGFLRRGESGPIEAGNMRFEAKALTPEDLKPFPIDKPVADELYSHATGRLLDRILVESTDRIVATRSPDSLLITAATDARFGTNSRWPNRWSTIAREGTVERNGPPQPYAGSVGYTRISRWKANSGLVVVEAHVVLDEPKGWFDGAPILRSKFNLIAQDQIRTLRREMAKAKAKSTPK